MMLAFQLIKEAGLRLPHPIGGAMSIVSALILGDAAVGAGIYSSVPEACSAIVKTDKTQQPISENIPKYDSCYKLYTEIYPALKDKFKVLAKL